MSAELAPVPAPFTPTRPALVEPSLLRRELARVAAVLTRRWEPSGRTFILDLVDAAHESTIRPCIARFGEKPSSIISRYSRAGLPSPKDLHTGFRLWLFLALRQRGVRQTVAGYAIGAATPQGCNRLCKQRTGMTAGKLPQRVHPDEWWDRLAAIIDFGHPRWLTFRAKAKDRPVNAPVVLL